MKNLGYREETEKIKGRKGLDNEWCFKREKAHKNQSRHSFGKWCVSSRQCQCVESIGSDKRTIIVDF